MTCKHQFIEEEGFLSLGGKIRKKEIRRKCKLCGKYESELKDLTEEEFDSIKNKLKGGEING